MDESPLVGEAEALKKAAKALTVIEPVPKQPDPKRVETLILYDTPTFDGDESTLVAEMEKQPW